MNSLFTLFLLTAAFCGYIGSSKSSDFAQVRPGGAAVVVKGGSGWIWLCPEFDSTNFSSSNSTNATSRRQGNSGGAGGNGNAPGGGGGNAGGGTSAPSNSTTTSVEEAGDALVGVVHPSRCLRMRPFRLQEVDAAGATVQSSTFGKKQVNNLYSRLTVGDLVDKELNSLCLDTNEGQACGYSREPDASGLSGVLTNLPYRELPITLQAFGKSVVKIYLYLFKANGTVMWDGLEVNVSKGDAKFDVNVENYEFEAADNRLEFELVVKDKTKSSVAKSLGRHGTSLVGEDMLNFPRFGFLRNETSTEWEFKNISVDTWSKGGNNGVKFSFSGPFVNASYDPVARVTSSGSGDFTANSLIQELSNSSTPYCLGQDTEGKCIGAAIGISLGCLLLVVCCCAICFILLTDKGKSDEGEQPPAHRAKSIPSDPYADFNEGTHQNAAPKSQQDQDHDGLPDGYVWEVMPEYGPHHFWSGELGMFFVRDVGLYFDPYENKWWTVDGDYWVETTAPVQPKPKPRGKRPGGKNANPIHGTFSH